MKKNLLMKILMVLVFVLGACASASAMVFHPATTPEIDPSLAISGLTLLAGSLAVLRAKRGK
jgi:uncharacterized lipoprotein YajG